MLRNLSLVLLLASFGCGGSNGNAAGDGGGALDGGGTPADGASSGDGGALGSDGGAPPDGGGAPITGLADDTWTFVPFADAVCRDGSATGIGINPHGASDKVMIFLQGGGACFNAVTCANNASSYGAADFASATLRGVLDRSEAKSAFKDWNLVYVPYCTGDVHSGNAHDVSVTGVPAKQQFVGYANMGRFLSRIVPTFPSASRVVLLGTSAGGFGASANYLQTAHAFGTVPVDLIDDSGPFMRSPYLAKCLQQQWHTLWGWDSTVLPDCGADCAGSDNPLFSLFVHMGHAAPNRLLGLIESMDDMTITRFFGFGSNDCNGSTPVSATQFAAGLDDIRSAMAFDPTFGAYYFAGMAHTSLTAAFDTRTSAGVDLSTWVSSFVNGTISNVGP